MRTSTPRLLLVEKSFRSERKAGGRLSDARLCVWLSDGDGSCLKAPWPPVDSAIVEMVVAADDVLTNVGFDEQSKM